jgi:uncharacterized protein YndB with AHSA1/START domain
MKPAPVPTGRLVGNAMHITRTFRAPIDDVWTSVTASESTARWIGPWKWAGDAGPGNAIVLTMVFEKGAPESTGIVESCEEPKRVSIKTGEGWHLEILLEQRGDVTTMDFVHHLTDLDLAQHAGPGWEYYLDLLVAARDGTPQPTFDEYYPSQQQYYNDLTKA